MGRSRWRPMRARQCINMLHRQPPITGRVKPILGVGAAHGAQQKKRRNNAAEGIYHEANYSRGEMPHCHRKATHMPPHLYFTCSLQGSHEGLPRDAGSSASPYEAYGTCRKGRRAQTETEARLSRFMGCL